jgi:hypothetical protein
MIGIATKRPAGEGRAPFPAAYIKTRANLVRVRSTRFTAGHSGSARQDVPVNCMNYTLNPPAAAEAPDKAFSPTPLLWQDYG